MWQNKILLGKIVLADELHTQDYTARQILYEQSGDYLLTVKGNQPTVQKTLESLFTRQTFSPSSHGADRAMKREHRSGLEIGGLECKEVAPSQVGFPGARLAARLERRVKRNGKWHQEVIYLIC